ncbi:uncharacterized protein MEPE_01888 [Melanopsichium pennsylvanicum]|uniref:Uncharacterized protein n=1 Tax=Melanopsichium pennsylvanicum TaxID=63383 RepID=A0AAJ4XIU0_9BASI|nr:uncharacterized protein MEPE_01888 [Melanopsichium pennsylvanicum]
MMQEYSSLNNELQIHIYPFVDKAWPRKSGRREAESFGLSTTPSDDLHMGMIATATLCVFEELLLENMRSPIQGGICRLERPRATNKKQRGLA